MEPLKFVALDPDDLEVVSTHLQDAEVKVADVHWRPQEKRLVIGLDRFDWQAWNARARRCAAAARRCASTGCRACKCKQVQPGGKDAVLNLLAVEFEQTDAPAGVVTLMFSGGEACGSRSSAWRSNWSTSGRPAWPTMRPADTAGSARHPALKAYTEASPLFRTGAL